MQVEERQRQSVSIGTVWARLWPAAKRRADQPLRRGAWYPVVQRDQTTMAVKTDAGRVLVDVHQVEVRQDCPMRFTVVRLSKNEPNPAKGTPRNLGLRYAVCPQCCARVRLMGAAARLKCRHCGHSGGIEEI